jgi:hypothetical protein
MAPIACVVVDGVLVRYNAIRRPEASKPPVPEQDGVYGRDPRLADWNRPPRTAASAGFWACPQAQIPVAKGFDVRRRSFTIDGILDGLSAACNNQGCEPEGPGCSNPRIS